jgi:hypothetical protein
MMTVDDGGGWGRARVMVVVMGSFDQGGFREFLFFLTKLSPAWASVVDQNLFFFSTLWEGDFDPLRVVEGLRSALYKNYPPC